MDLRYSVLDTPIGIAVATLTPTGLAGLRFGEHEGAVDALLRESAERHGAIPLPIGDRRGTETPAEAIAIESAEELLRRDLAEYFEGERQTFEVPLDLTTVHGMGRAALEAICTIPYGETASYGEVAILAGAPRAARAVGTACSTTPISVVVPVHRVVRADGSIGEYGGRPQIKRYLLDLEARNPPDTDRGTGQAGDAGTEARCCAPPSH